MAFLRVSSVLLLGLGSSGVAAAAEIDACVADGYSSYTCEAMVRAFPNAFTAETTTGEYRKSASLDDLVRALAGLYEHVWSQVDPLRASLAGMVDTTDAQQAAIEAQGADLVTLQTGLAGAIAKNGEQDEAYALLNEKITLQTDTGEILIKDYVVGGFADVEAEVDRVAGTVDTLEAADTAQDAQLVELELGLAEGSARIGTNEDDILELRAGQDKLQTQTGTLAIDVGALTTTVEDQGTSVADALERVAVQERSPYVHEITVDSGPSGAPEIYRVWVASAPDLPADALRFDAAVIDPNFMVADSVEVTDAAGDPVYTSDGLPVHVGYVPQRKVAVGNVDPGAIGRAITGAQVAPIGAWHWCKRAYEDRYFTSDVDPPVGLAECIDKTRVR